MKNLIWIFAFLLLAFLGDRVAGYILKKQVAKSQFRYSRLYNDGAKSDLLFIGNSRGLMFYQPYIEKITQKETFNLSYNGMSADLANTLVQDYYDRYPAPSKMVVDITLCDRLNDQLISKFNCYNPYSKRLQGLIIDRKKNFYYGGEVSHLFRYNNEVFKRALFYKNKSDEDWLLDRVISENFIKNAKNLEAYRLDYQADTLHPDYLLDELATMVKTAQAKGSEVHLVINPYFPAFAQSITNLDSLSQAVTAKTGLPVRDYSQAVQTTEGFGDYQHLNKNGARVYLDRLRKDGVFK